MKQKNTNSKFDGGWLGSDNVGSEKLPGIKT